MPNKTNRVIADVASATAAYLMEILPELTRASPREAYGRLAAHVEVALRVFDEERPRRRPVRRCEPSRN
jgi:hypothetical protein